MDSPVKPVEPLYQQFAYISVQLSQCNGRCPTLLRLAGTVWSAGGATHSDMAATFGFPGAVHGGFPQLCWDCLHVHLLIGILCGPLPKLWSCFRCQWNNENNNDHSFFRSHKKQNRWVSTCWIPLLPMVFQPERFQRVLCKISTNWYRFVVVVAAAALIFPPGGVVISGASSTMLTLKSQTPCGSNGASCWDAKPGECYGSPKNSLREKRHFFKTDFHRSSNIYRSCANPLLWQVVAKFVTQISYPVVKEQHRGSHSWYTVSRNVNCQFARYAFNLTSFPSGCVWKWGTPMYSQNGNLKDLKADLRIITLFSDKPFIHFIWQRLAKKQVHPSEFTSDSTPEFLKKHGQFRVCHRTSGQTTTCHLAETSISEGTHVEYCRNAIDLRLYATMHWISQTFPLAPGSKAKSSAKIKWIQVARNKVPRE